MVFAYRVVGYFGLLSVLGALLFGFRHDPSAPLNNYLFNIALYLAWAGVHLLMTHDAFKRSVYGVRAGTLIERQVYIIVTVITWLSVLWLHRAVPGPSHVFSEPVRFAATIGFLFGRSLSSRAPASPCWTVSSASPAARSPTRTTRRLRC